jgi:hypothetical protein
VQAIVSIQKEASRHAVLLSSQFSGSLLATHSQATDQQAVGHKQSMPSLLSAAPLTKGATSLMPLRAEAPGLMAGSTMSRANTIWPCSLTS